MSEERVQIRPARLEDASGIAHVHVDSWRTTYRGLIPDAYLDGLSYYNREQERRRILQAQQDGRSQSSTIVATEAETGRIVGFVNGGRDRTGISGYAGELYAIYLLEEVQGMGLGRRLTRALVVELLRLGITSMTVVVLAENPAHYFYEALGARLLREQEDEIGGKRLAERVYGWADIRPLL
ncbi:GNAT family N-acetyltransferase [Ktedonospora formicarum]|uniref:Putative N-acetyltransferase YuaI n=1 Tax=Ktedonospora formicarum TaxID=2778364 RepID=A0A8J3HXW5_9CHLR|nr:GNAT family N-acetyltransferase [Ktedonospora formicarum]GHO45231.1 putative N-acetyltransferase YuaI [Ktedonospora formicarum]